MGISGKAIRRIEESFKRERGELRRDYNAPSCESLTSAERGVVAFSFISPLVGEYREPEMRTRKPRSFHLDKKPYIGCCDFQITDTGELIPVEKEKSDKTLTKGLFQ